MVTCQLYQGARSQHALQYGVPGDQEGLEMEGPAPVQTRQSVQTNGAVLRKQAWPQLTA